LDQVEEKIERAHRYENYVMGMCIFHDGYRPNLMVHEDTYYCLSCGAYGSTESLVEKLSGMPVKITKARYTKNPFTTWKREELSLYNVLKKAYIPLKDNDGYKSYLYTRGLDDWAIQKLKIGYKEDWYTFPIFDKKSNVIGAVARAGEGRESGNKYIIPQGQDPNLLYIPSWERLEAQRAIFLTFGIIDAISIFLEGFASFSTTSGQRIEPSTLDQFRKTIYIFPDRGEESSAIKLANNLGWRGRVIRYEYHGKYKDPADLFISDISLKGILDDILQTT